jgi:hypothetical protein
VEVTDVTHPSVDEVALHLEGLLAPADERRVGAHLRDCAECAATARDLEALPEALRAAADTAAPPIPAEVAERIKAAVAREAAVRAGDGPGTRDAPPEEDVPSLAERRTRRRRALGAGLLAAAAATVVAVGLGELVQTGGQGDAVSGQAQQESAVAGARPAGPSGERGHALSPDGAPRRQQNRGLSTSGADDDAGSRLAGLVEGVAVAHDPDRARHERGACVRTALGLPDAADGGGAGAVASYAVRLATPSGAVPGAVVLRPSGAPTEGLVVACDRPPRVLLRHGLDR